MRILFLVLILVVISCEKAKKDTPKDVWASLTVEASAYNSTPAQTSSQPKLTAFGDSLKPGMKYIAVSRDLIRKGLKHNTPVMIEGFDEVFLVKDKMHHKWRNHIDIYMGLDITAAREWGRRTVCIDYKVIKVTAEVASD